MAGHVWDAEAQGVGEGDGGGWETGLGFTAPRI